MIPDPGRKGYPFCVETGKIPEKLRRVREKRFVKWHKKRRFLLLSFAAYSIMPVI